MLDERTVPPWVNRAQVIRRARQRRRIGRLVEHLVDRYYWLILYTVGGLVFVGFWLALDAIERFAR